MKKALVIPILLLVASCGALSAQDVTSAVDTSTVRTEVIDEVSVTGGVTTRRLSGAVNGLRIGQQEMFRAACCNLGESFVSNPSVDASYNDAATGAQQIKLLGLSGTYVQMLAETLPVFRGAAQPFALSYVPGTWMKAINVSKGAASVKNGYESISGQIDIDYLKPDEDPAVNVNLYADTDQSIEANADANIHVTDALSTNLLLHYQYFDKEHDENGDGFMDMPKIRQFNLSNRWKLRLPAYIMHAGFSVLSEDRNGGQTTCAPSVQVQSTPLYRIGINTDRYEAYMKHAYVIDPEHNSNIAFMANASMHLTDAFYGGKNWRTYDVNQKNLYAQLMYESEFNEHHQISVGMSFSHDHLHQHFTNTYWIHAPAPMGMYTWAYDERLIEDETVTGLYAQYTYTLGSRITAMAGIRVDSSSVHGFFVTPRAHIKYAPADWISFRLSAGKGYRTVHALAENHNLLASGRHLVIGEGSNHRLRQEEARNYGVSAALLIPIGERTLKLNGEYYYTDFLEQAVIDYYSSLSEITIHNLHGADSYSHVWQVDAQYELFPGLDVTAAYRRNNVKCTYDGVLRDKPLTSKYKALLSIAYKTPLELWQIDATLQLNGGGSLPSTISNPNGSCYHSFEQLQAQIMRRFRYIDVYVGGENLTGFSQKNAILNADAPWSYGFDATLIYAPVDGAMFYVGCRIKL